MLRTLPCTVTPLAPTMTAGVPTVIRPSSAEVTSARHSRRLLRINRNNSAPPATTPPTVAVRAEMTPSSGASTCVLRPRTCCAASTALAASTRAFAVCSAVWYWLICCWLNAPVSCSVRARDALPAASAAVARASANDARAWATSASIVSGEKVASTWPFLTTSPTFARTSSSRSPLASEPTMASCHGAMLPLAASVTVSSDVSGRATVTVRTGRAAGTAAACLSAVPGALRDIQKATPPATTMTTTSVAMRVERFIVSTRTFLRIRDAPSRRRSRGTGRYVLRRVRVAARHARSAR